MSLLGTQVFANPDTPIWLSATNPTVEGTLTVEGTFTAEGSIVAETDIELKASDNAATTVGRLVGGNVASGRVFLQGDTDIAFGKVGVGLVNTVLTLGTGGNADDVLDVAGDINTINFSTQSFSPIRGTATTSGAPGANPITFAGDVGLPNILAPNALYHFAMFLKFANSGAAVAAQEVQALVIPGPIFENACSVITTMVIDATPNLTLLSVSGYLRHTQLASQTLQGEIILSAGMPPGSTITIVDPFLLRID